MRRFLENWTSGEGGSVVWEKVSECLEVLDRIENPLVKSDINSPGSVERLNEYSRLYCFI